MEYKYLQNANLRKELDAICTNVCLSLQRELKDYFTFDFKLIGSGYTRLITFKDTDNSIDLDYDIIIQRDYKNLINKPNDIRDLFIKALYRVLYCNEHLKVSNSTSVITVSAGQYEGYNFSFDLAIMRKDADGCYSKIVLDKNSIIGNRFIWNKNKDSIDFNKRINSLKKKGYWQDIKKLYLIKKNKYKNRKDYSSSRILMEVVNDIYEKDI